MAERQTRRARVFSAALGNGARWVCLSGERSAKSGRTSLPKQGRQAPSIIPWGFESLGRAAHETGRSREIVRARSVAGTVIAGRPRLHKPYSCEARVMRVRASGRRRDPFERPQKHHYPLREATTVIVVAPTSLEAAYGLSQLPGVS